MVHMQRAGEVRSEPTIQQYRMKYEFLAHVTMHVSAPYALVNVPAAGHRPRTHTVRTHVHRK